VSTVNIMATALDINVFTIKQKESELESNLELEQELADPIIDEEEQQ
jgi:hypothetical protein